MPLPDSADISFFDYCLIEHVDHRDNSSTGGDLFSFAKRCGCPAGVAHTDMFSFIEAILSSGTSPSEILSSSIKLYMKIIDLLMMDFLILH